MKRHPELLQLSREHHGALKLARNARLAAASGAGEAVLAAARQVAAQFPLELDPHFLSEELNLLPRLEKAGEHLLVDRTLADHGQLRRFAKILATQPDQETLASFASLLADHVRFEERELFEAVQALKPV